MQPCKPALPVLKRFPWNPSADQNVEDNVVFLTNVFNAEISSVFPVSKSL